MRIFVGYVLYSLHVCVWARQIRQLRLTIPTSFTLCVVCIGNLPGGVPGGPGMPPLVTHIIRLWAAPWVVFAILAYFSIFSGFLN
jgi:hypothetical protein